MTEEGSGSIWALGDYDRFARELVWEFGPMLVAACDISPGQRVLDVAAGTGNVAIRAAEAGAHAVAVDITPESLEVGRREAEARGLTVRWVEGDAQSLPFEDAEFDVVTSAAGAILAPNHQATADEMRRVCRSGGTIGLINFRPERLSAAFFELFGRYLPAPPPDASPPLLWGDEAHIRTLFRDRATIETTRGQYVEKLSGDARSAQAYVDFYKENFGPAVAIYGSLADDPERAARLDHDFLELATRWNQGTEGEAEYHYDYLLVVARVPAS